MYSVNYIYKEKGAKAVSRNAGVFENKKDAQKALKDAGNHILQSLNIKHPDEELSSIEKDYFYLTDHDCTFYAEGTIDEREVGVVYLDEE